MRKLCLSPWYTITLLNTGKIRIEDLQDALFIFSCTRQGFFEGLYADVGDEELHEEFVKVVEKAETDGRVHWIWVQNKTGHAYVGVNEFLVSHGYSAISTEGFYYPDKLVERLSSDSDLDVILTGAA